MPDAAARPTKTTAPRRRRPAAGLPERTAVVSHEIRGPLGVMTALAELLLSRDLAPEDRHLVEMIRLAGAHVVGVTDDLLAEASLGADRFRVAPAPFSPEALARAVVALWAPLMQGGDRRIDLVVEKGTPKRVVSDEARIRQILFNLVSNASRATPSGTIEVVLAPAETAGRVLFMVRDTGAGLPANFTPAPFLTASGTGAAGTGLGLWISGRIAEELGGSLLLSPRPEGGAIARLELPVGNRSGRKPRTPRKRAPRKSPDRTLAPGRTASDDARSPLSGLRALVVEDSAVARMLLEAILSSFDMEITVAASGTEAVAALADRPADVVLLDWSLNGETGAEVLEELRRTCGTAMPPVVAVTAASRLPAMDGLAGHVAKPFTPRELFGALMSALHGAEALETA